MKNDRYGPSKRLERSTSPASATASSNVHENRPFFSRLLSKIKKNKKNGTHGRERTIYLNLEPHRPDSPSHPMLTKQPEKSRERPDEPARGPAGVSPGLASSIRHPPTLSKFPPRYPSNRVVTGKYTFCTFLPKNLIEQFHRIANIYFLLIIVLQLIPETSVSPVFIAVSPLVLIVSLQALKDLYEDYKRHQADREINNATTRVLRRYRNPNVRANTHWYDFFLGRRKGRSKPGTSGRKKMQQVDTLDRWRGASIDRRRPSTHTGADPMDSSKLYDTCLQTRSRSPADSGSREGASGRQTFLPSSVSHSHLHHHGYSSLGRSSIQSNAIPRASYGNFSASTSTRPRLYSRRTSQLTIPSIIQANRSWHVESDWKTQTWKSLQVGDFVFLQKDDAVPADIVVLESANVDKTVYVETRNLDGETNLKVKNAVTLSKPLNNVDDLRRFRAMVYSEAPNFHLYSYSGVLKVMSVGSPLSQAGAGMGAGSGAGSGVDAAGMRRESVGRDAEPPPHATSTMATMRTGSTTMSRSFSLPNAGDCNLMEEVPLNIEHLLLRGSVVRNTDYVIGVIAYTGKDTKIIMNTGDTPSKRSNLEKKMQMHVAANFGILALMCLLTGIFNTLVFASSDRDKFFHRRLYDFLAESGPAATQFVITTFASTVLYQNIVPISLYVAIETCKLVLGSFVYLDEEMKDQKTGRSTRPKTVSILDDLGQIEYIFSDKTGTLTQNRMQFRQCSIGGTIYGEPSEVSGDGLGTVHSNGKKPPGGKEEDLDVPFRDRALDRLLDGVKQSTGYPEFWRLHDMPQNSHERESLAKMFWIVLSVCHTVVATDVVEDELGGGKKDESDSDSDEEDIGNYQFQTASNTLSPSITGNQDAADVGFLSGSCDLSAPHVLPEDMKIEYRSPSPDEEALIKAARDVGFVYKSKQGKSLTVEIFGAAHRFDILHTFEFNSTRKRMSVVVQWNPPPETRLPPQRMLLAKGADSVMLERSLSSQSAANELLSKHLDQFARSGLRTLVVGFRLLSAEEFGGLSREYTSAGALLEGREEAIFELAERVESNLIIVGATAIEDKLQEGVPESIDTYLKAGIKVWVLTGDKVETAVNIGYSVKLLQSTMHVVQLSTRDTTEIRQLMEQGYEYREGHPGTDIALVISGDSLHTVMSDSGMMSLFLDFSTECRSVICCRVSALQKAQVVNLVRSSRNVMTLAIGDGANDVSMIQAANVGVGISGLEGQQAALASDFAIGQFRYLTRLLLVHGQWSYIRLSNMILNFFYKNFVWVLCIFWYQIYAQWSAVPPVESSYLVAYNVIFTVFPVLIIGIFDYDVSEASAMAHPQTYERGIRQTLYTNGRFWIFMGEAFYQSVSLFFLTLLCSQDIQVDTKFVDDRFKFGTRLIIIVVVVANLTNTVNLRAFNKYSSPLLFLCVISPFVYTILLSNTGSPTRGLATVMLLDQHLYLLMAVLVPIALMPRLLLRFQKHWWRPDEVQRIREWTIAKKA